MNTRTPYVSIDLETTGLDADYCQIIEFGAVIDDWVTPVQQLQRFHRYVKHERIVGEPFALAMNAAILRKIAEEGGYPNEQLFASFNDWLLTYYRLSLPVTVTGKNFASFDLPFIRRLPGYRPGVFRHRFIDPGSMFWQPDVDETPPSTALCLERAGLDTHVPHTAVEDAMNVIRLIRAAHSTPF